MPGYDPRALPAMALGMAVQSRGADHNRSGAYQADLRPGVDRQRPDFEAIPARVIDAEDHAALLDSLILCKFLRGAIPDPWTEGAELLRMTAGLEVDAADLRRAVGRIAGLRHLFNLREGWTIEEDTLPERFLAEALEGGAATPRAELRAMIERYHVLRGRGPDGRLDAAALAHLDLARLVAQP